MKSPTVSDRRLVGVCDGVSHVTLVVRRMLNMSGRPALISSPQ